MGNTDYNICTVRQIWNVSHIRRDIPEDVRQEGIEMNKHIRLNRKRQITFYDGYASEIQIHAISKMGVGLPEPPCRRRFQTTICCCFLRVMVVSNMGKGSIRSQVSAMETNKTEPLLKCRKYKDVIKTGVGPLSRDKSGGCLIQEESLKNPNVGLSFRITVQTVAGMQEA